MVIRAVVVAPEPVVRGHRHHEASARSRNAPQLVKGDPVVGQVLEHVRGEDQVETAVLEGELLDRPLADALQPPGSAELDRPARMVDALGRAEPAELGEVAAGAAAGVEDPGRRPEIGVAEERPDDASPGAKPPVAVLHLVVLLVRPILDGASP
jgi:hypothetical protein